MSHPSLILSQALLGLASFAGAGLALGAVVPQRGGVWSRKTRPFHRLVNQLAASSLACSIIVFALAWASGAANGLLQYPHPSANDEFGYLLAADTFAHGRLANPAPPLWRHFETVAVSLQPVYASRYPPAQAAFLALGQVTLGHPWWGQLLAYSLASAAVAWMLRAFVGPRWSLVGGVLVALHPTMQHFQHYDYSWANYSWSHSYWGGAVPMLGGALLFGGLRRFARGSRERDAAWLAIGVTVLVHSRPLEGALLVLIAGVLLLPRLLRGSATRAVFLRQFVAPAVLVLVPALLFGLVYNKATTGNPLKHPYQHYAEQYGASSQLLFIAPRKPPVSYGSPEMQRFHEGWARQRWLNQRASWRSFWRYKSMDVRRFGWFYLGVAWPALAGALPLLRRPWWRAAWAIGLLAFAWVFVTIAWLPHYAAPSAALIHAVLVAGMAWLWRMARPFRLPARLLVVGLILVGSVSRLFEFPLPAAPPAPVDWPAERAAMIAALQDTPGPDLVIVRYTPDHSVFADWIKNGADLEGAPVVWARELPDGAANARLVEHYAQRNIWLLEADAQPLVLKPFTPPKP